MSTKSDYSPAEWNAISAAPFLAGLYISMADPSGIAGITKEALAVGRALSDPEIAKGAEVVTSLAESLKAGGFKGRPDLPDLPKGDTAAARTAMIQHIQTASAAIAAKSPDEAHAYKAWLLAAAQSVAQAAKEGGFLGIGGTRVSAEEEGALTELRKALELHS